MQVNCLLNQNIVQKGATGSAPYWTNNAAAVVRVVYDVRDIHADAKLDSLWS
jgi:hypothetical protein